MRKPMIGVTVSFIPAERYGNRSDWAFVPEPYIHAVAAAGGIPVLLPNVLEAVEALAPEMDGFVLTGGADVDPACYTAEPVHPTVYGINPRRDETELFLARYAVAEGRPVLGICRGLQVLNVAMGGTLIQDIPSQVADALVHSTPDGVPGARHPVMVEAGSRLAEIVGGTEVETNTFHHQSIAAPAPGLVVVGRAADGVIEAVESVMHPFLLAVQWHPELQAAAEPAHARLFEALVHASARIPAPAS